MTSMTPFPAPDDKEAAAACRQRVRRYRAKRDALDAFGASAAQKDAHYESGAVLRSYDREIRRYRRLVGRDLKRAS